MVSLFRKAAPRKRDDEIQKILVVEYANLGDIVLLLPFLQNLRVHYPLAQITLLASPKASLLLKGLSLVDEVIPIRVPQGMYFSPWQRFNFFSPLWFESWRCLRKLRQRKFDLALTARIDVLDNLMLWMTGAARRLGYALHGGRYFLTDVVTPDLDHVHGADRWLALLHTLGKPVLERLPRLNTLPDENQQARGYLKGKGIGEGDFVVGIHPGARTPIRQWGDKNFRAVAERVARRFSVKILWFQDGATVDQAREAPPGSVAVKLDLRPFMAVLAHCQLLICNDSGPMHIAAALRVPVVSVFGPTKPEWFGPLGAGHGIVIRSGFWCRPCADRCIFDKPYCLRTITTDEVFDATAEAILSLGGDRRLNEDGVDFQSHAKGAAAN
jgi:heptosyltransferase-2